VARQSRGLPIESKDERLAPIIAAGRAIFERRQGQLNLACSQCHDDNWGQKLAGNVIPQGHPTGYPLYRLEWQTLGSLQRRLRNCLIGMRAETLSLWGVGVCGA
jgi:sulfur-oxidizing protein SoxA